MASKCTILYHNYYGTAFPYSYDAILESTPYAYTTATPFAKTFRTGNIGKDIGGKLFLLAYYLRRSVQTPYILFTHDKKSPQVVDGDRWRNRLLAPFRTKALLDEAIDRLQHDREATILCANGAVSRLADRGELGHYGFANKELVLQLASHYACLPENKDFVAGTIFLAKAAPLRSFFSQYDPLEIRGTLERGNVLDYDSASYTHAWERLLSWISTYEGQKIIEVDAV